MTSPESSVGRRPAVPLSLYRWRSTVPCSVSSALPISRRAKKKEGQGQEEVLRLAEMRQQVLRQGAVLLRRCPQGLLPQCCRVLQRWPRHRLLLPAAEPLRPARGATMLRPLSAAHLSASGSPARGWCAVVPPGRARWGRASRLTMVPAVPRRSTAPRPRRVASAARTWPHLPQPEHRPVLRRGEQVRHGLLRVWRECCNGHALSVWPDLRWRHLQVPGRNG